MKIKIDHFIVFTLIMCIISMGFMLNQTSQILIEQTTQLRYMRSLIDEEYDLNKGELSNYGVSGRYFIDSTNIELYTKSQAPLPILNDASHEVGHYIYYELIPNFAIDEYEDIYDESTFFVTDYASTNAEEDFAETFAEAVEIKVNWDKIPLNRQGFFDEYVRNYFG